MVHSHNDEDVLEVGADGAGGEGQRPGLLEDDGDDVVPDVPLPQELPWGRVGWGGYMGWVWHPIDVPDHPPHTQPEPHGPAGGLVGVKGSMVLTWNITS